MLIVGGELLMKKSKYKCLKAADHSINHYNVTKIVKINKCVDQNYYRVKWTILVEQLISCISYSNRWRII